MHPFFHPISVCFHPTYFFNLLCLRGYLECFLHSNFRPSYFASRNVKGVPISLESFGCVHSVAIGMTCTPLTSSGTAQCQYAKNLSLTACQMPWKVCKAAAIYYECFQKFKTHFSLLYKASS